MPKNTPPSSVKTAGSTKPSKLGSLVSLLSRTRSVASQNTSTPLSLPRQSRPIPPRPDQSTRPLEGNGPALSRRPFPNRCDHCPARERFTSFKQENPEADIDFRTVFASEEGMTKSDHTCENCSTFSIDQLDDEERPLRLVNSLESQGPLDDDPQEGSSTGQRHPEPGCRHLSRVTQRIPPSVLDSNAREK